MSSEQKNYQKPKLIEKRIKISFFLSHVLWQDQFNLVGKVYAQSNCSCDCQQAGSCECSCSCSPAGDAGDAGSAGDAGDAR